jgi:hypothetical protein
VLARQVLYHWSHTSNPFCSGCFEHRVSLLAQAGLELHLPDLSLLHSLR